MTMWNLTLHRAATGTVENICACPHHDLNFFVTREVEYLVLAHGPVKRTFPGVGNSDTQIITNVSFEDGTSIYFNATKIESDDQSQTNMDTPDTTTVRSTSNLPTVAVDGACVSIIVRTVDGEQQELLLDLWSAKKLAITLMKTLMEAVR